MNLRESAARPTLVVATDHGEVVWTPVTERLPAGYDTSDLVAHGHLFGPAVLTDRVRGVLSDSGPESVETYPWPVHTFSKGRDTVADVADVAAAMAWVGGGRSLPCAQVRAALAGD